MTTGSALNCVSRSSQSRIDELPRNSTPPGCNPCRWSASANAAMLSLHREDGGAGAARPIGTAARADVKANHGASRIARRIRERMWLLTDDIDSGTTDFKI